MKNMVCVFILLLLLLFPDNINKHLSTTLNETVQQSSDACEKTSEPHAD